MSRITRRQRQKRLRLKRIRALVLLFVLIIILIKFISLSQKSQESTSQEPNPPAKSQGLDYGNDYRQLMALFDRIYTGFAFERPENAAFKEALYKDLYGIKSAQSQEAFAEATSKNLSLLNDSEVHLVTLEEFAELRQYFNSEARGSFADQLFQSDSAQSAYPKASSLSKKKELVLDILVEKQFAYIKPPNLYTPGQNDSEKIKTFLNNVKDYSFIVYDLRGCSGLNLNYWIDHFVRPFIRQPLELEQAFCIRGDEALELFKLFEYYKSPYILFSGPEKIDQGTGLYRVGSLLRIPPKETIYFYGDFFILQDEETTGAAAAFSAFAKATGFAKIVGTRSGGATIASHPQFVQLETSGLVLELPLAKAIDDEGSPIYHIQPDVPMHPETDALNKLIEIVQIEP